MTAINSSSAFKSSRGFSVGGTEKKQPGRQPSGVYTPNGQAKNNSGLDTFKAAPSKPTLSPPSKAKSPSKDTTLAQIKVPAVRLSVPRSTPPAARSTGAVLPSRSSGPSAQSVPEPDTHPVGAGVQLLEQALKTAQKRLAPPAGPIYFQQPDFALNGAQRQFTALNSQILQDRQLPPGLVRDLRAANSRQFVNRSEEALQQMPLKSCPPSGPWRPTPEAAIVSQRLAREAGVKGRAYEYIISSEVAAGIRENESYDPLAELAPDPFANTVLVTGQDNLVKLQNALKHR